MDDNMNNGETIEKISKENRTWEILDILNKCKDLEEAKEKIRALLNKKD